MVLGSYTVLNFFNGRVCFEDKIYFLHKVNSCINAFLSINVLWILHLKEICYLVSERSKTATQTLVT